MAGAWVEFLGTVDDTPADQPIIGAVAEWFVKNSLTPSSAAGIVEADFPTEGDQALPPDLASKGLIRRALIRCNLLRKRSRSPPAAPYDVSPLVDATTNAAAWIARQSQLQESIALLDRETTVSELTVDLCTSTRGRLWQLKRALPLNIIHTWPHRNWCKIHVVVCCRNDGSVEWMRENCREAIDVGLLNIYQVARDEDFRYWHASVAKNSAANVASGDILVNVDSDNIIGPDFCVDVAERFKDGVARGHNMVLHYENVDGTCGRIACFRKDFYEIQGYDEEAHPMGAQDVDLLKRLEALPDRKYQHVDLRSSSAIPNSVQQKIQACDPSIGLTWEEMNTANYRRFWERRQLQPDLRNQQKGIIGVCVESASREEQEPVKFSSVPVRA